jgi:hypothetical protein
MLPQTVSARQAIIFSVNEHKFRNSRTLTPIVSAAYPYQAYGVE